jgi:4-amino-4-deoxy-L-arabinose transferase-like glycosyltransferase
MPFVREFFFKHHFERMYSGSLQHVQPWYYYVLVMLGALFPWTPLFLLFARRRGCWDGRRSFLLATVLFGFLFFSVIVNKLPGYLLPLLPALFVLLGAEFAAPSLEKPHEIGQDRYRSLAVAARLAAVRNWRFFINMGWPKAHGHSFAELSRKWLIAPVLLIALIPPIAKGLPDALATGNITAFHFGHIGPTESFYVVAPVAALLFGKRSWLVVLLVLCVVAGGILLKTTAYPLLDEKVSARGLWRQLQSERVSVCDGGINRAWAYGISFYRGSELPVCGDGQLYDRVLRSRGRDRPAAERP